MNALMNMGCVRNGQCSIKEMSIVEMNSFIFSAMLKLRESGASEKVVDDAVRERDAIEEKAKSLPEEFFANIDCTWEGAASAVLRAVMNA